MNGLAYSHLAEAVKPLIEKTDAERLRRVRSDKWIGYRRAVEILESLNELVEMDKKVRMPCLLIYGLSNNGKSSILNRFIEKSPISVNEDGDFVNWPVFDLQAPPGPDIHLFFNRILDKLFAPYNKNDSESDKLGNILQLFDDIGVKVLVIDEIQHFLAGTTTKTSKILNTIKYISNELKIPIVAAGTEMVAQLFAHDSQLANRFDREKLEVWENDEDFLQLLASYEQLLPLKQASNLVINEELADQIYEMSEGLIGEINNILVKAASTAIKTGQEKITSNILNNFRWVKPSKRKAKS